MIVKKVANPKKSSSKAVRIDRLTAYVRAPERDSTTEKCIYEGARGFISDTAHGQTAEMVALAEDAPRSKDPVGHYILSWRGGETPTPAQVEGAVDIMLDEFGLQSHQAIYGLHADTDNIHLHVVVNRVHPDTLQVVKINRGFDIEACHRAGARIEVAQGWTVEANKRYRVSAAGELERNHPASTDRRRAPSQQQLDAEIRTGEPSAARSAIERAAPILKTVETWAQLHAAFGDAGMVYRRKGSGAVVTIDGDVTIKASRLARGASMAALQKRLGPYVDPIAAVPAPERQPAAPAPTPPAIADPAAALPLIEAARSWSDLHARLATAGLSYNRKGSGATVTAGETTVKASAVSRRISLSALERRLGPWTPARSPDQVAPKPAPAPAQAPPPEPTAHEIYEDRRAEHAKARDASWHDLMAHQQAERRELARSEVQDRADIDSFPWTGIDLFRRALLLAIRLYKWRPARRRLRDQHHRAIAAWRRQHPAFLSFTAWLPRAPAAIGAFTSTTQPPAPRPPLVPIDGFNAIPSAQGDAVHYVRSDPAFRTPDFTSRADRVDVHARPHDDEALLAALTVAANRWGAVHVSGDDDFKRAVVQLAIAQNFELHNPELRQIITDERARRTAIAVVTGAVAPAQPSQAPEPPPVLAVEGYTVHVADGAVRYSRAGDPARLPRFSSHADRVDVHAPADSAPDVLAALQLAAERWGTVHVTGDPAFRATVVRLAARHEIPIANFELQDEIRFQRRRTRRPRPAAPASTPSRMPAPRPPSPAPPPQPAAKPSVPPVDPSRHPDFAAVKAALVPQLERSGASAILGARGGLYEDPVHVAFREEIRRHPPIRRFLDAVDALDPPQPDLPHLLLDQSAPKHLQRLYDRALRHWSRQCRRHPDRLANSIARAHWPALKDRFAASQGPAPDRTHTPSAPPERRPFPVRKAQTPAPAHHHSIDQPGPEID